MCDFKLGDKVRLAADEGLDLPTEEQGKTGQIMVAHYTHILPVNGVVPEPSFTVLMDKSRAWVNCEIYHLEPV